MALVGIFARQAVFLLPNGKPMRKPSTETDRLLLTRLQARDEAALEVHVNTCGPKIYQLAFPYLRNEEDAEEVAQDVLYKVYRKIGAFRGDSALSSWIYRITFNSAMSRVRTASHRHAQAGDRLAAQSEGVEPASSKS